MDKTKHLFWFPLLIIILSLTSSAQSVPNDASQTQTLYSPTDAEELYTLARDLWVQPELDTMGYSSIPLDPFQTKKRVQKAELLLDAAARMDPAHQTVLRDRVLLLTAPNIADTGRAYEAVLTYARQYPNDKGPFELWLGQTFQQFQLRQQRENFLLSVLGKLRSPYLQSHISYELGSLAFERGDLTAAAGYFQNALGANPYHYMAMARLMELQPDQTTPQDETTPATDQASLLQAIYPFLYTRTLMEINPYDLQATLDLIDLLEEIGETELIQTYYQHAYRLLDQMDPDPETTSLRDRLQQRQAIDLYQREDYFGCIALTKSILSRDKNALPIHVLQWKTMDQLGQTSAAQDLRGQTIQNLLRQDLSIPDPNDIAASAQVARRAMELAWYFCLIQPEAKKALQFAQIAYQADPDEPAEPGLLAYAMTLNEQWSQAQALLPETPSGDPIETLARAKLYLHQDQPENALAALTEINLYQTGMLRETISQLIDELKAKQPEEQTASAPDTQQQEPPSLDTQIKPIFDAYFHDEILRIPEDPAAFIHCKIQMKNNIYSYGDPIKAQFYLTNLSEIPLFLGPDSFVDGHILVTAEIRPSTGAATSYQPIPLLHRYMNQQRNIPPGHSLLIEETLNVGALRQQLQQNPQQEYTIIFRAYLDPVLDATGQFTSQIQALQPRPIEIIRKGFSLTPARLANQRELLETGTSDQKIKALQLLAGLLSAAQRDPSLPAASWQSQIIQQLQSPDIRLAAWAGYALGQMDYQAIARAAADSTQLLQHPHWFPRFMALFALAPVSDLEPYLQWTLQTQQDPLLIRQALSLLGQDWPTLPLPFETKPAPEPEPEPEPETTP